METFLIFLPLILTYTVFAVYAERKISAFIQDRYGPMEVGFYGIFQTVADLLKLLQKEDIKPKAADSKLFKIAPALIFVAIFAGFAVIPLNSSLSGSMANVGVFYLLAIVSLDVIGILMAGWGSNSKFSLFGAIRSVAQIISYEIPLGLTVLCVVMISQSLNLQEISFQQGIWWKTISDQPNYLFGISAWDIQISEIGGILTWNIFRVPILFFAFIIFFISSLAEANRAPFDLPESESELVGGYHTEYSGFRWALIMLSEYGMMLLVSFLAAILFLGSWNTPFPNIGDVKLAEWTSGVPGSWAAHIWGTFWLISKAIILVLVQMWVRWTYPRLRVDQLMIFCWKYLIPASLLLLVISGIWRLMMI
ncbi:complex I subunit 1/NuoH family protein [Catalinimonas niigatensis]|uniref:complex I subunit 1/NuoH family protein n=1 Tax=Catalinimonas niigatensis TaxID=1397264 RepID=UPI0026662E19|nr:complex I subunit 1 family protein [Catalinimonas niigatensis]WPP50888.1 complex I subunit 1 family protein [Catalinimonas niigatensis]